MAQDIGHVFEACTVVDHLGGNGMPEDMARDARGDDDAGVGECLPDDPPDRAVGQRLKRRPTAQKDLATRTLRAPALASRPPSPGPRRVGGVSCVPGESCRAAGPSDHRPNRYRLSRARSRPARGGQDARAGRAWRGYADCWRCRRGRRPAPAPRPRGASVSGSDACRHCGGARAAASNPGADGPSEHQKAEERADGD